MSRLRRGSGEGIRSGVDGISPSWPVRGNSGILLDRLGSDFYTPTVLRAEKGRSNRLLKNAHLLKFPSSFAVQRTAKYASRLRISGALYLDVFEQPAKWTFSTGC
jgi:hypothetical protein